MIEIYARDEHGIEAIVATYETYEEFFARVRPNEDDLKEFGYNVGDRTARHHIFPHRPRFNDPWYWNDNTRYCYLVYEYDKFVTPDNLVGKFREWDSNRPYRRFRWTYRAVAYQNGRPMRGVVQEKRAYYANDDDDAPRIRAKRSPRLLPDDWDRSCYPAEKCWKSQSKRKGQWK